MGNKKDKKKNKKHEEKVVVDVKVEDSTIPEPKPAPKPVAPMPDDMREFWAAGEFDDKKSVISLFNNLVRQGYTVEADFEYNRNGFINVIYKIKKAG